MSEIEAGAAKTKQALTDATATVAGTAKTNGSRMGKFFRVGLKALPLLPERSFEYFLDRIGLERKRSGLGAFALFAGGFAAGSIVTAFSTPVSGAVLREKVWSLTKRFGVQVEEKAEELADAAVDAEKKLVTGAKDLVAEVTGSSTDGAKDVGTESKTSAKDYSDELHRMKRGIDSRTAGSGDGNGRSGGGGFSA